MRYEHDWMFSETGVELCRRCGGWRCAVFSGPSCRVAPEPPPAADPLGDAVRESAFDRLDRLHKRRPS